jgi:hypothetical protein
MPEYVPAPTAVVEQIEEQLYGRYVVAQAKAAAIIRRRRKTINIRWRRNERSSLPLPMPEFLCKTAEEIAGIESLAKLPHDWKPPARSGGPFYPPQEER